MYLLLPPAQHIFLTIVLGVIASILFFVIEPHVPPAIGLVGGVLGTVCGIMQHLCFTQAPDKFSKTSSFLAVLDVRRAFKSTSWGRRYIWLINFSGVVLFVMAFFLIRQPLLDVFWGCLAGLMSLGFMRELITLRDSFSRQRLSSNCRFEE